MNRSYPWAVLAAAGFTAASAFPQNAPSPRRLSLTEAVHLALSQNHSLKIARLKVIENEHKKAGERAAYFPSISNQSNVSHVTNLQSIGIPAGALGEAGGSLVPASNILLPQGQTTLYTSGTMLAQPLTQLIRIHAANKIGAEETAASREDVKKVENEVALQVHALYFEILVAGKQKQAAEQQAAYAGEQLRESEEDVRYGSALKVTSIQGRARLLEGQQAVLTADLQLTDLTTELNDLLGLPLDTKLDLDPAVPADFDQRPREEYLRAAWSDNPEIHAAEDTVGKARAGVVAAKSAYLPDVTAYARQSYQDGVPFLVRNFGTFGVTLNWDVFDFGKRRAAVKEREAQLAAAQENLLRLKEEVAVAIDRGFNKVERTRSLVKVANEIVALRHESERLAGNQAAVGVVLASEQRQAVAATYKAEADYLQAKLGYLLAWAELEKTVGHTPGL